jgi:hypothetical protein
MNINLFLQTEVLYRTEQNLHSIKITILRIPVKDGKYIQTSGEFQL